MDRYNIRITLSDGNVVEAAVDADSCDGAVEAVKSSPVFRRFAGEAGIVSVEPLSVDVHLPSVAGYTVSVNGDTCSCADIASGTVIAWSRGMFNDTVEVISTPEGNDAKKAASALRRMTDWLVSEKPHLVM